MGECAVQRGCNATPRVMRDPRGGTIKCHEVEFVTIEDVARSDGLCDCKPRGVCQREVGIIYNVLGVSPEWLQCGGTMLGCYCIRCPCQPCDSFCVRHCGFTVHPDLQLNENRKTKSLNPSHTTSRKAPATLMALLAAHPELVQEEKSGDGSPRTHETERVAHAGGDLPQI